MHIMLHKEKEKVMSRDKRIRIKLILILCGILILATIAVIHITKIRQISQKEGEYIPLYQVLLLMETVEPALEENAEFATLKAESQNMEASPFMTYRQYLDVCEAVSKEGVKYPLFEKEYKEEYLVTKEDFEAMYALFLQAFDTEGKMQTKTITLLGAKDDCVLYDGTTLQDGEVLTTDGVFAFEDLNITTYRFHTVEIYCYDNKLITVKKVVDTKYEMNNIWVMESDEEEIRFFLNGYETVLKPEELKTGMQEKIGREQIADLIFEKGILTDGCSKSDKINGKILSMKDNIITLEGKGEFEVADNFKAYRLYGTLEEIEKSDLIVGYDFTDFVIENGKICAGLVVKKEEMSTIRVLLKNSDYSGLNHEEVTLSCDSDFTITYGILEEMQTEHHKAGDTIVIDKNSDYFTGQRIYIEPDVLTGKIKLLHLQRNQGTPEYRGKIELSLEDGNIYVINEVLLEEYLYSVVPSEMPSSYPAEALKAQAVCARTYAYAKMLHSPLAWYGAHVDDSTSYQVYNNIAEKAETTKAVKETAGMLLTYEEELVGAYYYSTSCGFGTTAEVWKSGNTDVPYLQAKAIAGGQNRYTAESLMDEETFANFIQDTDDSYFECEEGWYRWNYTVEEIDCKKIEEMLQKRYEANDKLVLTLNKNGEYESKKIKNIGQIKDIYVEKRNPGGVIDELVIVAENAQIKVITEHNIRYVLNNGEAKIERQDGSEIASPNLLPSAFFMLSVVKDGENVIGYSILGGGYGHGVGMSQNGAKAMAEQGWNYEDILNFFYDGSMVSAIQ